MVSMSSDECSESANPTIGNNNIGFEFVRTGEEVVFEDRGQVITRVPTEHGDQPWQHPPERGLSE